MTTKIKSGNILDGEVRTNDLSDSAVTKDKLDFVGLGVEGDVLTVDNSGNLLFVPIGLGPIPISLATLTDVDTTGVSNGDALVFNGITLQFEPETVAGIGVSSNTFIVQDITARNALSPDTGDQAFVRVGTSGEYEHYIWDAGAGPAAWILLATQDSARTDANTIETFVNFDDISPQLLGNISDNSRVTTITIQVITIFDGADPAPKLSVGDDDDNGRIIGGDPLRDYLLEPDFDLKVAGTYTLNVDYVYDGTEIPGTIDTDINAYFDFTGATQGQARIIVTHV